MVNSYMAKKNSKKLSKKEKRDKMKLREEKRLAREAEKKERMSEPWTKEERMLHTSNVINKMKGLGLGIYEEEIKVLNMIVENYVYKAMECETLIPIKGTKRNIFINLKMSREEFPTIKLIHGESK